MKGKFSESTTETNQARRAIAWKEFFGLLAAIAVATTAIVTLTSKAMGPPQVSPSNVPPPSTQVNVIQNNGSFGHDDAAIPLVPVTSIPRQTSGIDNSMKPTGVDGVNQGNHSVNDSHPAVPSTVFSDGDLAWTAQDNGRDVDWKAATKYCSHLTLNGWSDWRLPTSDEAGRFYRQQGNLNHNIKEPFLLTGWYVWSSSSLGSVATGFSFRSGRTFDDLVERSSDFRAFCVRYLKK